MEKVIPKMCVMMLAATFVGCATSRVENPATSRRPASTPAPVTTPPKVHRLKIGRVASVPLSNAEADRTLAGATRVLRERDSRGDVGANVILQRDGDVRVIDGPAVLQSAEDRARIGASGVHIGVVEAINYCHSGSAGVVGCAPIGGSYLVLVRQSRFEDLIWAHEFGHNCGIGKHRNERSALMHQEADASRRSLNAAEAAAFERKRPGAGVAALVSSDSAAEEGPAPTSVAAFLDTVYVHGIPYEHVTRFGPGDAPVFRQVLADPSRKAQWLNASVALGSIGTPEAIAGVHDFIRAGRGRLGHEEFRAKLAAVAGLGYGARKKGEAALEQLRRGTSVDLWKGEVRWSAPGATPGEPTAKTLTSAAFTGLSLSRRADAAEVLESAARDHDPASRLHRHAKAALQALRARRN